MKRMINKLQKFTLKQWLIIAAILGVLIIIVMPMYLKNSRKTYYSEIVDATSPFKAGVEECYQRTHDLTQCNGGNNYIPADITMPLGPVTSLITTAGVITVVPATAHGILSANTYVLTPTVQNNNLTWTRSGGGINAGLTQ